MQDWAARPAGQAAALPKVQGVSKQLLSLKDTGLKKSWGTKLKCVCSLQDAELQIRGV